MAPSIDEFEAKGWYLSQEGIDLIASENEGVSTLDDYISCALNMDLRLLATTKGFNKTSEKLDSLPTPLVLQVLEVRNIAMPSVSQVEKPRLLSVTFTDGSKKKYKSVESLGKVDCLKLHTPPGTKFLVTKPIAIKDQIVILGPGMLKELGGNVQEMVQAWRAGKQFLKRFGGKSTNAQEGVDGGPPAFVPFKVKEKKPVKDDKNVADENKKERKHDKQEPKTKRSEKKDADTKKGRSKTESNKSEQKQPSSKKNNTKDSSKSVEKSKQDKPNPSPQTSTENKTKRKERSKEAVKGDSSNRPKKSNKPDDDKENQKPKKATKQVDNAEEKDSSKKERRKKPARSETPDAKVDDKNEKREKTKDQNGEKSKKSRTPREKKPDTPRASAPSKENKQDAPSHQLNPQSQDYVPQQQNMWGAIDPNTGLPFGMDPQQYMQSVYFMPEQGQQPHHQRDGQHFRGNNRGRPYRGSRGRGRGRGRGEPSND